MSTYSIKQLELVSGIKAHTIRIWEKRYGLFSPIRTDTNIRKYDDSDVRLILNITLLLHKGYRISKVASKSLEEISQLVLQQGPKEPNHGNNSIEPLIIATLSFNSLDFKAYLAKKIKEHGLGVTYETIISPFLNRIGILWQAGVIQTTHEHFASNLIKHLITFNYESLKEPKDDSPLILFFLPEGEFHELGLLFYAFLLKQKGYRTVYFGQSTPAEDLIKSANELKAKAIFTSASTKISTVILSELVNTLQKNIRGITLFVTGYTISREPFSLPKSVKIVSSLESLEKSIKSLKSK